MKQVNDWFNEEVHKLTHRALREKMENWPATYIKELEEYMNRNILIDAKHDLDGWTYEFAVKRMIKVMEEGE